MTVPEHRPPGSEYADALRDVVEHAARAEASRPPAEPRPPFVTRPPVMAVLALTFVAVVAWDVRRMSPEPPASTPEEEQVVRGLSVLVVGQAVEAYRREHGTLPESLEEVGFSGTEYEYLRAGETFEIRLAADGADARYDSRADVEALVRELVPPQGRR